MPPRQPGRRSMRAVRQELGKARRDDEALKRRLERLQAEEAELRGGSASSPRRYQHRITRTDVRDYLIEHPESLAGEIADSFGVPTTNVSTHLSNGKKDGEFRERGRRWSVIK
jgi:hypothetical protein